MVGLEEEEEGEDLSRGEEEKRGEEEDAPIRGPCLSVRSPRLLAGVISLAASSITPPFAFLLSTNCLPKSDVCFEFPLLSLLPFLPSPAPAPLLGSLA